MTTNTYYWVLFIGIAILSYIVQLVLEKRFKKASGMHLRNGMTGADVARKMLEDNGIHDVRVVCVQGHLTDHYNPADKTLNLSDDVYGKSNVAAAAVAAHECGHALQHACGYAPLKMRSSLVPVVSFSSRIMTWILLAGMLTIKIFPQVMLAGIILFALTTLFSVITLPVEVNASRRALNWLESSRITDSVNHEFACETLRSAAYTYFIAALSSLATLVYYILIYSSGRRN